MPKSHLSAPAPTRAKEAIAFGPVVQIVGQFLALLGLLMLVPAAVDLAGGHGEWRGFALSAGATGFVGLTMVLANRGRETGLDLHQGFLLTSGSWIAACAFGALPFVFSDLDLGYTDAFFEAMSGLTTTGSTVIIGLDGAPPGILLWRGLLQGIGGIGIIVVAVAMLPFLKVGGMQLFRLESSDISDKAVPQAQRLMVNIIETYVILWLLCVAAFSAAGMGPLDAVVHAFTTISTGGYSNYDASIGHFASPAIDWTVTLFMILGSLPFLLYVRAVQGHIGVLFRDRQAWMLARALAFFVGLVAVWLWSDGRFGALDALRFAAFNVTSIMTTTGYATADYTQWGPLPVAVFFLVTLIGGCTGSTAGAIKIFRWQILVTAVRQYMWRRMYPHGVRAATYMGRPVTEDVVAGVLLFILVYLTTIAAGTLLLAATGLDLVTSLTGAAQALGNVGPGLGDVIGPAGNYAGLPDAAKWVLSFLMLLGRLELFTVLVLLTPAFWRG
jgi:trk system potassium uptake protein TrkH